MGFSLKKLLEGAAAQVNMNDGGKTFATVVRNQPVQSQPAKTPPPSYGSNPVKQAINRTRDVFDANTPQDRFKRQLAQKPVIDFTAQDRARQTVNGVKNVAKPMAQSIAKPFQQFGNALVEGNRLSYIDLPKAIAAQTSGNKQAMANINADINQRLKGQGAFGAGMPRGFTSLGQGSKSFIEDPEKTKSMLGTGVQIGTTVAPMGKGFTLGSQVFSQPIKETGKTLLRAGGANAVLSGGGSAGMQLSDTGKIDLKQLAKDTLFGTAVGTGMPFIGGVASKGTSKAVNTVKGLTKENIGAISPRLKLNNQIGAIGRNVNDSVDPLEALKQEASVFRSEAPNRYGIGQAELGSGLYTGSREIAGRTVDGKVVTDGLYEYKVNPKANILDSSSDVFKSIDAKASNDTSLKGLDGRAWQQRKADLVADLVKQQGYDGVRRGSNQVVAMSDKALIPVSKNAPVYTQSQPPKSTAVQPDPLESLKQEARKYKSAEEFINSQKSVYHGTNADITEFGQLKGGRERGEFSATNSLFASENPELAGAYGKNLLEGKNTGKVLDTTTLGNKLDPNERVIPDEFADYKTNPILEPRDRRVLEESYFKSGTPSNITIDHLPNIQEYFRSKGYSAIQIPRASDVNGAATEMVIIDPTKIKTKQQLTDLYNQAKGAPIEKTVPSVQKFGWNTEDTPQGIKLFNRNGKHVATITEKKGRYTASYTDGARIATGNDANKLAEDVARKTFYAQELPQSQNLGGTLRPDKAPEPYKNPAVQSELSPERANTVQANTDKMKSALEFDKTPTPKKAYHSTGSLDIEGGKLRASGADSAMGEGVYLHTNPETAKYAGAMQADGNIADQTALDINLKTDNLFKWAGQEYPTPEQVALIKSRGYDGIYKKGGEIVVFDPNKIEIAKSGAPIEKTPNPTVSAIEEAGAKIKPTQSNQLSASQNVVPDGYKASSKTKQQATQEAQSLPKQKPHQIDQKANLEKPQPLLPDNSVQTDRTYANNTPEIDTKQYVKEMGKQQKLAGKGTVAGASKLGDAKAKFIDDLAPIEDRLNKAIKNGAEVDPKDHITYQLDRSRRAEGIMNAYMNDNGLSKVIQDVPNPKEFDQYLIAKHTKELDADIRTGRDPIKDAALVKQLDSKYGEYAKQVYSYNQKLLDSATEYGLISKQTADMLKKKYPEYVPLNRIFKEDELAGLHGNGSGSASISSQGVVNKLKGSERSIRSPLNSIIDKTRVVIEQGERNKSAQLLVSYKDLPDNPFNLREIKASETIGNRSTIAFLDNGKKRVFEVDKEIADAAKNMSREEIGLWGRIAAVPARVLRAGATGVNAGFAGANIVKDIIGAAINSKHPFRIADPRAMGKALAASLNHNGKYYQELMREGIAGTSFDMYRNALKSNIGEIRSQKNIGRRAAYNISHPGQWYRTVENTIGRSEDFGRALQYYSNKSGFEQKYGKNSDATKILAADQARNNSTNFFRHGSYGKNLNLAIPYWNAGVQGTRITLRRVKERPVQTVAKIGLAIAAPSAMIAVNNYKDENKRNIMAQIEEYEKDGNIIIVGDDAKFNEQTGRWDGIIKIPVPPQHLGIHKTIQNAIKSKFTGEKFNPVDNLGTLIENYTTIDPTDARQIANKYVPQGIKLIAEPMTNTNFFTGNKIVPESQKNLPAQDQYGDYTSGIAKVAGKLTNTSPRMIDNSIRTGMGGAGQNAVRAVDSVLAKAGVIGKDEVQGTSIKDSITNRFDSAKGKSTSSKIDKNFATLSKEITSSDEYKNASQYDKQRMLNRLQSDISEVAYFADNKGKPSPDGKEQKLSKKQQQLLEGFDKTNYTDLTDGGSLPKNLRPEAVNVIANYNAENAKQPSNDKAVKEALKAWNNGNDLPLVTNEVAKQWAEYERKAAEGSLSKIAAVDEKKKILRNAYNSQLNKDERDLYKLSATRLRQAYNDGLITDENINKALMVERQMFDNGLLESETLAKNLGLASRNKSAKSSGRKKSSGGSRRASSKKLKTTKTISLDTFKKYKTRRSSTNASLRKLLGSAKV